jgi:hypothetical protein
MDFVTEDISGDKEFETEKISEERHNHLIRRMTPVNIFYFFQKMETPSENFQLDISSFFWQVLIFL